jgi:hypothetical protein
MLKHTIQEVSLGLWVDDPKNMVLNEGYFRTLDDLGIDLVAIMIDQSDRAWKTTWTEKDVEKALRLADDSAKEVVLTTWPWPCPNLIDAMATDMAKLINVGPIAGWEVDLEFNWKPSRVNGFVDIDKAGDYLVRKMTDVQKNTQVRLELTSFTSHTENGRAADVSPHMNRVLAQAYSIRERDAGNGRKIQIGWDHIYGPGHMQKMTLDRTMLIPDLGVDAGDLEFGCGLAAWSQEWPGHTAQEAMKVALDKALEYPIVDIRYWSSKHVLGVQKNKFAFDFIKSLRS